MPSAPKPKQFVAARSISYRGQRYAAGDPVTDRRTIAALVRYGDRFLTAKSSKPAPAETPAVDTAITPQPESTKED